jgi:hypothetical protein
LFVVGIPSNPPCDAPKTITQLQYHLAAVSDIDEIPQGMPPGRADKLSFQSKCI